MLFIALTNSVHPKITEHLRIYHVYQLYDLDKMIDQNIYNAKSWFQNSLLKRIEFEAILSDRLLDVMIKYLTEKLLKKN